MKQFAAAAMAGMIVLAPAAMTPAAAAPAAGAEVAHVAAPQGAQYQAIRKAQSYLRYSAFSRSGLIDQLEYEGFSTGVSTRAVGSLRVSWRTQAAKKAKSYLRYSAFSSSGLYEQLRYEGFSRGQAWYGVRAAGL